MKESAALSSAAHCAIVVGENPLLYGLYDMQQGVYFCDADCQGGVLIGHKNRTVCKLQKKGKLALYKYAS
jgi:hypothetical protein